MIHSKRIQSHNINLFLKHYFYTISFMLCYFTRGVLHFFSTLNEDKLESCFFLILKVFRYKSSSLEFFDLQNQKLRLFVIERMMIIETNIQWEKRNISVPLFSFRRYQPLAPELQLTTLHLPPPPPPFA